MDAIINIPELLEEVLSLLSFPDLVMTTGVNHTFRNFIFTSHKLQRKLFLLPAQPPSSRLERKHFSQSGIFGTFLNTNKIMHDLAKQRQVTLCPFLLKPSYFPDTPIAHLTVRAAEARFWPNMYLTNPPCAHAHIRFSYHGIDFQHTQIVIEASRSLYRHGGITFMAIEEALHQLGSVTIRVGKSKATTTVQRRNGRTLSAEVERLQDHFECKLSMDVRATSIRLHGVPVMSEEVSSSLMPMGRPQGLRAWGAQKIRFEDQ
jgi:hypothetical protein